VAPRLQETGPLERPWLRSKQSGVGERASGQATGKRQHKPFIIVKQFDKATPLLLNALVNNENLTTVTFTLLRGGQPVATVKLTNASIADYVANGESEHWAFTYQKTGTRRVDR
jgi:type VI secretion system Hcp family effector